MVSPPLAHPARPGFMLAKKVRPCVDGLGRVHLADCAHHFFSSFGSFHKFRDATNFIVIAHLQTSRFKNSLGNPLKLVPPIATPTYSPPTHPSVGNRICCLGQQDVTLFPVDISNTFPTTNPHLSHASNQNYIHRQTAEDGKNPRRESGESIHCCITKKRSQSGGAHRVSAQGFRNT